MNDEVQPFRPGGFVPAGLRPPSGVPLRPGPVDPRLARSASMDEIVRPTASRAPIVVPLSGSPQVEALCDRVRPPWQPVTSSAFGSTGGTRYFAGIIEIPEGEDRLRLRDKFFNPPNVVPPPPPDFSGPGTQPGKPGDPMSKERLEAFLNLFYCCYDISCTFTLAGKEIARGVNIKSALVVVREPLPEKGNPDDVFGSLNGGKLQAALNAHMGSTADVDWDDLHAITFEIFPHVDDKKSGGTGNPDRDKAEREAKDKRKKFTIEDDVVFLGRRKKMEVKKKKAEDEARQKKKEGK